MTGVRMAQSVEFIANRLGGRDVLIDGELFGYHVLDVAVEPIAEWDEPGVYVVRLGVIVDTRGQR